MANVREVDGNWLMKITQKNVQLMADQSMNE
jgi:hypothetical protein